VSDFLPRIFPESWLSIGRKFDYMMELVRDSTWSCVDKPVKGPAIESTLRPINAREAVNSGKVV